jgi:hypothetical protein
VRKIKEALQTDLVSFYKKEDEESLSSLRLN